MGRRLLLLLVVMCLVAAACSGSDDTDSTTSTSTSTPTDSSTTTLPATTTGAPGTSSTTTAPAVLVGSDFTIEPAATCGDLVAMSAPYPVAVGYWVREQRPASFDPDGDGVPCETEYPESDIADLFDRTGTGQAPDPGLFCRDLFAIDVPYRSAVAYWLTEGAPDRMDADRNGIPCETVYPVAEIMAFYPRRSSTFTATRPPFGNFPETPLLGSSPVYAGPDAPASLTNVMLTDLVDTSLSPAARSKLTDLGFVVVPADDRLMHQPYERAQYSDTAVYVTTDAAFHYWHLAVSKVLRDSEEQVMLPALEKLVSGLVASARERQTALAGSSLESSIDRVTQYFEAVATVLEVDVGPIGPLAAEEAALAAAHTDTVASPTLATGQCQVASGFRCVYYSLFKPRGHYTRSADLERYFVAMSLLGNAGVMVFDSPDPATAEVDVESVRRGLLLADLLAGDPALVELWETVYEPTAFLVGNADDYTPLELVAAATAAGFDASDPGVLGSDEAIEAIVGELISARPVKINVPMASVRLMGSRFVIDSYILDQLPLDNDGFFASGLDVANVFGSSLAQQIREGDRNVPVSYAGRARSLAVDLATRTIGDWAATIYDAWLYALRAVWADHGAAFPDYMQSDAWEAKNLQTGLGSYAELKHDTILYAKQRTAEGDFPWAPERANWVEPDPVVYGRLAAAARMLHDGLMERGLIEEEGRLDVLMVELRLFLDHLDSIATAELAAAPLSEDEAGYLASIGALMEQLYLLSADEGDIIDQDDQSAIIADIYTGQFGIREVATGRIDHIYVIVPGPTGAFEVAVGGVYSFYEFQGSRETDEEWRAMLDSGTAPDRPPWQAVFLAD